MQFLRARENIHTVVEGLPSVYCIQGNNGLENSYQPIPCFVCKIEALIPRALPSGFMLLYMHTNLGSWFITITCGPNQT